MLTKAQVKHIQSLADKKYRQEHQQFVVEGDKMVQELINSSIKIHQLYATPTWTFPHAGLSQQIPFQEITESMLDRISMMSTPNQVLAIAKIPVYQDTHFDIALVLDRIQDPGNLGSIVRIADWFGIPRVFCSPDSADAYNSKVIQASMGSIFRVPVTYQMPLNLFETHPHLPVYGGDLNGKDLKECPKIDKGFIVIGNESKGIDIALKSAIQVPVRIPGKGQAESLNAAVATGILCYALLS